MRFSADRARRWLCIALVAASLAHGGETASQVRLSIEQQRRLGLAIASLQTGEALQLAHGFAQVLDATSFIALVGDWRSATAMAEASSHEATRLAVLYDAEENASLKAVEAARAQAAADQAKVQALTARIRLEWSDSLLGSATALAHRLAAGEAILMRVEFSGATRLDRGAAISLTSPYDASQWHARAIGAAGGAQAMGPGSGYLAEVAALTGLHAGQRLLADAATGSPRSGVVIPSSAVVAFSRERWCYEQKGPDEFVRRALPADAMPIPAGYLVDARSWTHPVVVHGAGLILSAESAATHAEVD